MQALHWPNSKRLKLAGVVVSQSAPAIVDPDLIQQALSEYWGRIYQSHDFDLDAAIKFANLYVRRNSSLLRFENLTLPDAEDLEATIAHAKPSSAGEDGIPYGAYKILGKVSAQVLAAQVNSMATPNAPSHIDKFNKQIVWFAPKGIQDGDSKAVYRTPDRLRTIFGSNCDSKLVAGAVSYKLTPAVMELTPSSQRGFCKNQTLQQPFCWG